MPDGLVTGFTPAFGPHDRQHLLSVARRDAARPMIAETSLHRGQSGRVTRDVWRDGAPRGCSCAARLIGACSILGTRLIAPSPWSPTTVGRMIGMPPSYVPPCCWSWPVASGIVPRAPRRARSRPKDDRRALGRGSASRRRRQGRDPPASRRTDATLPISPSRPTPASLVGASPYARILRTRAKCSAVYVDTFHSRRAMSRRPSAVSRRQDQPPLARRAVQRELLLADRADLGPLRRLAWPLTGPIPRTRHSGRQVGDIHVRTHDMKGTGGGKRHHNE